MITEQAARAANIPVIGEEGGDESMKVQFFIKKTPVGTGPQPLAGEAKSKSPSPFVPKFGDVSQSEEKTSPPKIYNGDKRDKPIVIAESRKDIFNDSQPVVTTDPGVSTKGPSLTMCGKVFTNGNAEGEKGSNNRLSALFGSCDNFSVLGKKDGDTNEKENGKSLIEHSEDKKDTLAPPPPSPGSTNFAEISSQKMAVAGNKKPNETPLASPKSSLKSSSSKSSSDNNDKLQNPTTWGAIGLERGGAGAVENGGDDHGTTNGPNGRSPLSIQLSAMRMRLEEKKRAIERDKIRAENRANKDRQR